MKKNSVAIVALSLMFTGIKSAYAQTNGFFNVLKIMPLDISPAYFYIDTNIPASDSYAPQLQITGYTYAAANKALKITLGWYYYAGNFYWTQYQSDLGYQKPSRIRLGKYTKSGTDYIRIEISNNSVYWASYNITATDISPSYTAAYSGWIYASGEMPTATTSQITTVGQPDNVLVDGKLSVNGTIHTKEVKVDLDGWYDYVLKPAYKLPALPAVEAYINQNHHLLEIPSEAEMVKNGLDLAAMNKLLMKKVEELTLYLIRQNKAINGQQHQIDQLKRKLYRKH
ncbi:hypothetical protein HQ865_19150 [Mucilaginibacter mali]|uniref:Uncharacterized protein n=1 Tax=Mucilaginibacter mali TaxID=2740462 RepID=A0A7D4TPG8_9SPHI|nr:hypothetical protein [Mucilaginibacter mali]QKJ31793.1 hypothetical protein HQ865_19150 [Mucilaginibacter mali]